MKKPYMPLMMGDWRMLTSGLRADAKGVTVGLLIHQYHHGHLPQLLEDLQLIEPEVGKVWVSIQGLFPVTGENRRQNPELEETRAFWSKQASNGSKGGRPPKGKPNSNPNQNPERKPKANPEGNLQDDPDPDPDQVLKIVGAPAKFWVAVLAKYADERTCRIYDLQLFFQETGQLEQLITAGFTNFDKFMAANPGAVFREPGHLYNAFKRYHQQPPTNGHQQPTTRKQHQVDSLIHDYAQRHSEDPAGGDEGALHADSERAQGRPGA